MKKLVSLVLALVLLTMSCGALAAFDMSAFRGQDIFDVYETDAGAIITSTGICHISHEYECDYSPSQIYSGIIVLNQNSFSPDAQMFTRIELNTTKALDITDVAFIMDGKKYILTDVSDAEDVEKTDDGYEQNILLTFGTENTDLLLVLVTEGFNILDKLQSEENWEAPKVQLLLHGTEDITVELGKEYWLDYAAILVGILASGDYDWILDNPGDNCIVRDITE